MYDDEYKYPLFIKLGKLYMLNAHFDVETMLNKLKISFVMMELGHFVFKSRKDRHTITEMFGPEMFQLIPNILEEA